MNQEEIMLIMDVGVYSSVFICYLISYIGLIRWIISDLRSDINKKIEYNYIE
ncbi:MAG: hypothetical protein ACTSRP_24955 [Candidatus Helarchaeota archaeon]